MQSSNGHKSAVIYARVSTDDQAEKGYSLPSQLEACRKYAKQLHFEVVAELCEDISGAIPIAERPEGKKLTAMLKSKQANAIIIYHIDRVYRDNVELLLAVRTWRHDGIEVHSCDIGKIDDENNILLVIKGWQASDERKKIAERTIRGRNGKAKAGYVVGQGYAPYGYCFDKDPAKGQLVSRTLVIVKKEGHVVKLIFIWYTTGDNKKPLTARGIAEKLSFMRTPTPGEAEWRKKKRVRANGLWSATQVLRILSNETYCGTWRYGKKIGRNNGRRPLEEQIEVAVPAIIDRELWNLARAKQQYNKEMAMRNCRRHYLLRGLIRCGCGSAMTGTAIGKDSQLLYYHCTHSDNHQTGLETVCKERMVRCESAEAVVWDFILDIFANRKKFERSLRLAQKAEERTIEPMRERLEQIKQMIAECDVEVKDCANALVKASGAVGKAIEAKQREVNSRHDALEQERDRLQSDIDKQNFTDSNIQAALQFREDVVEGMKNPTWDDKRRILEQLRVRVTVQKGKVKVAYGIPRMRLRHMNQ